MNDPTESIRHVLVDFVNQGFIEPNGQTWTTEQLRAEFEVCGFMAPFVLVRRKSDGVTGSMMFRHDPRVYFSFEAV